MAGLRTLSGTQIGTIDYQTGHIVWTNAIGTGTVSINITFKPAAMPTQPFESYALPVTANNQGTNWTGCCYRFLHLVHFQFLIWLKASFTLKDNGTGRLVGANDSIGRVASIIKQDLGY
jgi:hypothetical protein